MTQPTPDAKTDHQLLLTNDNGLGQISVEMQAFFEFSFWMAEQLEDLVAKHRAKPRGDRRERGRNADKRGRDRHPT